MIRGSSTGRPSPFAVFRRRDFTLLWLAQFISTLGNGLTSIAAAILVYRATGSALSVGLMLMAAALPTLLVGLVAGVFVDRFDRKRIVVACELLRGLLVISIPFLLPYGVVWLYVIVALSSALAQFFDPAQASMLPELAPDEELTAANSMMTISQMGAEVLGVAMAGLIAAYFEIAWAFYLDGLTFFLGAGCLLLLRVPAIPAEEATSVASIGRNLRAGLQYVGQTGVLRSLVLVFIPIFLLFGFGNALNLPFVLDAVGLSEFEYGLVEGISMVGFVLGSLLMAGYAERIHAGQWISLSIIGMALAWVAFGLSGTIGALLLFGGLQTFLNAFSYIGRTTLIQRSTPRELRGRVFSVFFVTRDCFFMVGMALVALGDFVDLRLLMVGSGLLLLGCGLLTLRMPGLGQPSAEWRRMLAMLRTAPQAPGLGLGRAATLGDIEALVLRLPPLGALDPGSRQWLARQSRVFTVEAGTAVVRQGEAGDAAYFLLDGRTVASRAEEDGGESVLELHAAGDFFGEIAALTGAQRTASVLAEQPSTLLQVPASALRQMAGDPQLQRVLMSTLTERLARMRLIELPRLPGLDQAALRELRSEEPAPAVVPQAVSLG